LFHFNNFIIEIVALKNTDNKAYFRPENLKLELKENVRESVIEVVESASSSLVVT